MSTISAAIPCSTAVGVINEIEARGNAFQLVVPAEHKTSPSFIEFQLWEDGSDLPHTVRLNKDGTWYMKTEIEV